MKAILQRVLNASVTVESELVSSIGKGVLVFAAVAPGDTEKEADTLAARVLKLKLWDDEKQGRWKLNVKEIGGEVLCVSQFTLFAKTNKGNKPDFHGSASGEHASRLYHYFHQKVCEGYAEDKVKDGRFQAMMQVALVNDGPVTFEVEVPPKPVVPKPEKAAKPKKATENKYLETAGEAENQASEVTPPEPDSEVTKTAG